MSTVPMTDKEYAEVKRQSVRRCNFVDVSCRHWMEEHHPELYKKIREESYRRFPVLGISRRKTPPDYSFLDELKADT